MISCAPVPNKTNMEKALSFGDACRGNAVAFLNTLSGKAPSGSPQQEPVKKVSLKGAVLDMSEGALPPEEQIYNQLRNKLMETYPGGVPDGEKLRIMLYELNKKGVGLDLSNSPEGKKAAIAVIGSWMKDGNITVDPTTGQVSLKEGSSVESQMVSVDKFLKPEKKDETKQDLSDLKKEYEKQGEELKQANEQADKDKLEIQKGKEELVKEQSKHAEELKVEQDKTAVEVDKVKDLSGQLKDSQEKEKVATEESDKVRQDSVLAANKHADELRAEKDKTAAAEGQVTDLSKKLGEVKAEQHQTKQDLVTAKDEVTTAKGVNDSLTNELSAEKDKTAKALAEVTAVKEANEALEKQVKELNEKLVIALPPPKENEQIDPPPEIDDPQD